jgi:hypothetical protein
MLALGIVEGFARGLVSLHTPPLLGRKSFEAKSRVSTTSKLIEITGLQVLHFGHLRKIGGGWGYRLVNIAALNLPNTPLHSEVNPVAEDQRQGGAAHDYPQDQPLQQRANADVG